MTFEAYVRKLYRYSLARVLRSVSVLATLVGAFQRAEIKTMIARRDAGNLLLRILAWPVRVAEARRDFAMLARLGERELRDIGLSGQDLRDMSALPLSENATTVLARRARSARRWRGAQGRHRRGAKGKLPPGAPSARKGCSSFATRRNFPTPPAD